MEIVSFLTRIQESRKNARDVLLRYINCVTLQLSQAFTDGTVSVEVEEILRMEDISAVDIKFHFTDGVGTLLPIFSLRNLDAIEVNLATRT